MTVRPAQRRRVRPRLRHRDGGGRRLRAGHRPAFRRPRRGHGPQPVHEGGPLHLHPDRYGLPGVPGHCRRRPSRRQLLLRS
eukprot:12961659-Heterocapsa_arctica.AAC.1